MQVNDDASGFVQYRGEGSETYMAEQFSLLLALLNDGDVTDFDNLGLITSNGRILLTFDNGATGSGFFGFRLKTGGFWNCQNPRVLAETFELWLEAYSQGVAVEAARAELREHFAAKIGGE